MRFVVGCPSVDDLIIRITDRQRSTRQQITRNVRFIDIQYRCVLHNGGGIVEFYPVIVGFHIDHIALFVHCLIQRADVDGFYYNFRDEVNSVDDYSYKRSRRLGEKYGVSWLPETGAKYQLQFSVMNDRVQLYLDTSGPGLHKRGYRANGNDAPLRETLAAAMVTLTRYRGREFLWDPFCGSGTIPIEAAMIAKNKAPGAFRRFSAEAFAWIDPKIWGQVRTEAKDREFHGNYRILGSDNDPKCVSLSMANARKAGLGDLIEFRDGDATKMSLPCDEGILICNPPYGQRMMEQKSAQRLYADLGRHLKFADGWKKYVITSEPEFEHYFGKRADKKRKLYNGMIKCDYYMYLGQQRKGK